MQIIYPLKRTNDNTVISAMMKVLCKLGKVLNLVHNNMMQCKGVS